jgi:hypothetical protein
VGCGNHHPKKIPGRLYNVLPDTKPVFAHHVYRFGTVILGMIRKKILIVLNLDSSCPNPERILITQPRVARNELPWVTAKKVPYPEGGCINPKHTVHQIQSHNDLTISETRLETIPCGDAPPVRQYISVRFRFVKTQSKKCHNRSARRNPSGRGLSF